MLILSLDSTTRAGSYALWRDGELLDERVGDAELSHAERLPNELAKLLATHEVMLRDITMYAVSSGPGSFTGLRVGVATIQGFALVHDRLVVPVPSLEALAQHAAADPRTIAAASRPARGPNALPGDTPRVYIAGWSEAYRGEVFGTLYEIKRQAWREPPQRERLRQLDEVSPSIAGPPDVVAAEWRAQLDAARFDWTLSIIGDAVTPHADLLRATFPEVVLLDGVPTAGMIARIADQHPERGVRPHAIEPLYVRRPDVELKRARDLMIAALSGHGPSAN